MRQAALERILHDIKPPPKHAPPEPAAEAAQCEAWDRTHLESHWPPLYHSPALHAELAELYEQANSALAAVLAPPVEEDPKKKSEPGARGSGTGEGRAEAVWQCQRGQGS